MHLKVLAAGTVAILSLATRASAAPVPHPFEAPPTLPGQVETLPAPRAQALALTLAAPSTPKPCRPAGLMTRNGPLVSVKLEFVRGKFAINNPDAADPQPNGEDPVELRSYGGCKSGPAIEVRPGDTLRVQLINETDTFDPSCLPTPPKGLGVPVNVGCYNTTNLHLHGLHVSPVGNSDNVLLNITPQTQFPYEINVPADHPSGTFWYHAHRHGSTAVQVASGTAGVLIVRGDRAYAPPTPSDPHPIADIDTVLHGADGKPFDEQLFLLQQIAYACFDATPGQPGGPWSHLYTTAGLWGLDSPDNSPAANAPWTCPLSTPGHPVTRGAVENFELQLDSPTIWDTNGRFTSINGVVQPTITVMAGKILRWRFVHAGIHDTINLQVVRMTQGAGPNLIATSALVGNRRQQKATIQEVCAANAKTLVPQFEIASDGLTRARLHTIHASTLGGVLESNYLQPGYRSDILVAFPSDGDYCLLDQQAPASERVSNGGGGQGPSTPQLLAYVHVRGGVAVTGDLETYVKQALYAANPQLPPAVRNGLRAGDLSPWAPLIGLPPATGQKHAQFQVNTKVTPIRFGINDQIYDPDVVNFTAQVNTTDDWLLTSIGEPHIFHIHVNPFEVMDITIVDGSGGEVSIFDKNGHCRSDIINGDGQNLANQYCGMWHTFRDTIFVENGFNVHVRTTYDRYIGEFVLHCHILDHEDAGMMMNVAIVPELAAPGGGLGMAGMHHHGSDGTPTPH